MCLILFAHEHMKQYKLVLVANRDEYHQRETKKAARWQHQPRIFGGIDCVAGGSWLSVDDSGRLAAVTNVRKPPFGTNYKYSRGLLVSEFLSHNLTARDFMQALTQHRSDYGLFNLILLDDSGLWHYSNDTGVISQVEKGIHGLCNASLNTPWPKLSEGRKHFNYALDHDGFDPCHLFSMMQSQIRAPDEKLPKTGVNLEFERLLSSIFIKNTNYGTRSSTLITIDYNNVLEFCELSYKPCGSIKSQVSQSIPLVNTAMMKKS